MEHGSNKSTLLFIAIIIKLVTAYALFNGFFGFMTLGDSDLYLGKSSYDYTSFNSTYFTVLIYSIFLNIPFLSYAIFGILITYLYYVNLPDNNKVIFLSFIPLLLLPSGVVWSSIPGKEQIFLLSAIMMISFRDKNKIFFLISFICCLILRPPFAIAIYILLMNKEYKLNFIYVFAAVLTAIAIFYYNFSIYYFDSYAMLVNLRAAFASADGTMNLDIPIDEFGPSLILAFFENAFVYVGLYNSFDVPTAVLSLEGGFSLYVLVKIAQKKAPQIGVTAAIAAIGIVFFTQLVYGGWNEGAASRFRAGWLLPLWLMYLMVNKSENARSR